jgi:hypothetical protein
MDEERTDESRSGQAQHGHGESDEARADLPTTNPDFSVPELNPAFTEASPPPPQPPDDVTQAQRDIRIRELEQLLEEAAKRIERGAAVLERSRRRR